MSRMVKLLLVTLLGGALLFGAVFGAAASLTVSGVSNLGSNNVTVNSPTPVTGVSWSVSDDGTDVDSVTLSFGSSVTGTAYVTLYDNTPAAIGWSSPTAISGTSVVVAIDGAITDPADVMNILITITEP